MTAEGAIGIVAYAASWIAHQSIVGFEDPLWLRLAIIGVMAGVLAATYVSRWAVKRLGPLR